MPAGWLNPVEPYGTIGGYDCGMDLIIGDDCGIQVLYIGGWPFGILFCTGLGPIWPYITGAGECVSIGEG